MEVLKEVLLTAYKLRNKQYFIKKIILDDCYINDKAFELLVQGLVAQKDTLRSAIFLNLKGFSKLDIQIRQLI